MYVDQFGFIPTRLDLLWTHGQIRTLEHIEEAIEWFQKHKHQREHYLYPPIVHTRVGWPHESSEKVEGTDRQAHLYGLPSTHEVVLFHASKDRELSRNGPGAFVIHFLGFFVGRRCQFHDWWFDGRIPERAQNDYVTVPQSTVSVVLEQGFDTWLGWAARDQTVFINALYLHNRAPSYEWDWERFMVEYQVLDALYRIAHRTHGVHAQGHAARIAAMCDFFGLYRDDPLTSDIVKLRNDLLHEALWGGQQPGTAPEGTLHMPIWLHRLNQRIALAILGFANDYTSSNWHSLGAYAFRVT